MNKRPNIVFIITDQQRYDTIAAHGYDYMITPNLDRLAREGTSFLNMYVTSPSCGPSRASLFSGVYPHTNGVFRNDEPWNYCWVQLLNEAGYRCVNVGKMHTFPPEKPFGFHERHVVENKDRTHPLLPFYLDNWDKAFHTRKVEQPSGENYRKRDDFEESLGAFVWPAPDDLHPDHFVADLARWWLERYRGEEPFFLQVGLPGPHPPYDPTEEALELYEGRELPPPIPADDFDEQPLALQALANRHLNHAIDGVYHPREATPDQERRQRACYYANVTMIDRKVGEIIDALEARGVLDNTVLIFTSDHGDCLRDHGHVQKWNMYEASARVPAIIHWPGRIAASQQVDDLVALFDFGPTILDLAGITPPDWMEAQSLRPFFEKSSDPSRERVFAEHANDLILEETEFVTMIREGRWKLVHYLGEDRGQLFDLEDDPQEIRNRWSDPGCTAVRAGLIEQIFHWRLRSSKKTQGFRRAIAAGHSMLDPGG
ncbi:MAG: sulfatase-like hydrolase/transferase [Geminicoccaceae bacterium]|nr:sulfatase-like hydrolase/transferase [Geminicoccaceae bacterium]